MRTIRQQHGLDQVGLASRLNARLGRSYDQARVSIWESNKAPIPAVVEKAMTDLKQEFMDAERRCVVVAVANQKGGVGKTTSTVNIGYALSLLGAKVLVIDADYQGNLTDTYGGTEQAAGLEVNGKVMTHVLANKAKMADIILPTPYENVDLAPATLSLSSADNEINSDLIGGIYRLRNQMKLVRPNYDVAIIDCAPSLSPTTLAALVAADYVIIPVQTEKYSLLGVTKLLDTITSLQAHANPTLQVLGMLPTMHNERTNQHRAMLDDLKHAYGAVHHIWPPIPRADMYGTAAVANMPALAAKPDVRGNEVIREIAAHIFNLTRALQSEGATASVE